MKKVLVTGISGFIGHQCAVELLKNGYSVKGTVRDLGKKDEVINGIKKEIDPVENLEFVNLDLLNDKGWDDAMKDCEYVLHVASPFFMKEPSNEDEYIKPACEGTIRVLKAAPKVKIKSIVLMEKTARFLCFFLFLCIRNRYNIYIRVRAARKRFKESKANSENDEKELESIFV